MKKSVIRLILVAVLVVAASFMAHAASGKAGSIPILKPGEAFDLIKKNKDNPQFVILDVRTPEEFQSGHIPGAINIDLRNDAFEDEIKKLDREKTYLVYCRTGRRTKQAVSIMQELGFTHLLRIDGDITGWRAEKLPVAK